MNGSDLLESWRYILGDDLLAFLVGEQPGEVPRGLRSGAMEVLAWLTHNVELLERSDQRLPVALVREVGDDDIPLAWQLRRGCGREVPNVDGVDDASRHLAHVARDTFPLLLAPHDLVVHSGPGRALPAASPEICLAQVAADHPAAQLLHDALRAEGILAGSGAFTSAMSVTQITDVDVQRLLASAANRLRHAADRSAETFIALSCSVLAELRAAVCGRPVDVPALVGFAGLPLPSQVVLELPQGRLRSRLPGEARYAPFSLLADAVLETSVSAVVVEVGGPPSPAQLGGQLRLQQFAREVCLAAALGSPDTPPRSCPCVAWVTELPPVGGSAAHRPLHPARAGPGRAAPLSSEEISGLVCWAGRVATVDLSHVSIAVDRLLRALWEPEWPDSLIDAVIAWENLVGTTTETAFRVTAALARLCDDEPTTRLTTRKKLAAVYDARSRLVHGDAPRGPINGHRDQAIVIALEALRRLISTRTDLLGLAKSSARADRLLLAG